MIDEMMIDGPPVVSSRVVRSRGLRRRRPTTCQTSGSVGTTKRTFSELTVTKVDMMVLPDDVGAQTTTDCWRSTSWRGEEVQRRARRSTHGTRRCREERREERGRTHARTRARDGRTDGRTDAVEFRYSVAVVSSRRGDERRRTTMRSRVVVRVAQQPSSPLVGRAGAAPTRRTDTVLRFDALTPPVVSFDKEDRWRPTERLSD